MESPKYVAYGIVDDGIYLFDLKTKELKYYFELHKFMSYVYPTSIICFTNEIIVFVNKNSSIHIFNHKLNKIISNIYISEYKYNIYNCQLYSNKTNVYKDDIIFNTYNDEEYIKYNIRTNKYSSCEIKFNELDNSYSINTSKYPDYFSFRRSDTYRYKYYVSLEYFVEITKDNTLIWEDYNIINNLKINKNKNVQLSSVSILNGIDRELKIFKKLINNSIQLNCNITNIISNYL